MQQLHALNHDNIRPFIGFSATVLPGVLSAVGPWIANGNVVDFVESRGWEEPSIIRLVSATIACEFGTPDRGNVDA